MSIEGKCRVFYRPNGEVAVAYPAPKAQRKDETEAQFLERVYRQAKKGTDFKNSDYKDMLVSELPPRTRRDAWRGDKTKGLWVDANFVTHGEEIKAVQDQIDAEIAKPDPDNDKVFQLEKDKRAIIKRGKPAP